MNVRFRDELLNGEIFYSLREAGKLWYWLTVQSQRAGLISVFIKCATDPAVVIR